MPDWMGDDRVFLPQGYEPGYAYPLLVWLPEEPVSGFDLGRVMSRLSLRNYVAVQPEVALPPEDGRAAADTSRACFDAWSAGPDEAVWRAIDRLRDRVSIHPERVYLVGQGAGGGRAFRLACRHPESFAGVISLGGGFPVDEALFARIKQVRRLPMLLCCRRDADEETARKTDRTLRLFHAAGATLALRIYPAGAAHDDLAAAVLGDVNRWIMEDVCGAPAAPAPACASEQFGA